MNHSDVTAFENLPEVFGWGSRVEIHNLPSQV